MAHGEEPAAALLELQRLTERLRRFAPGSDVGLALGVVVLLSVLVLPLPTILLDLACNKYSPDCKSSL